MSGQIQLPRIKLLVAILDRGQGVAAIELFRRYGLWFDYLCMGKGTASSRILDYFGLSETEKDVVLTLVPAHRVPIVMAAADGKFDFRSPGRGILFTLSLSGVSGLVPRKLCQGEQAQKEAQPMDEKDNQYDLIVVAANRGNLDTIMDAARSEGARGGTVLNARRVGSATESDGPLGFGLEPEQEVVAILAPRRQKHAIMVAVQKAAGPSTQAGGILLSLPVEDMMGLQPPVTQSPSERKP